MASLPDGWSAHQDAEGRTFYANAATGESSWEPPAGYAPAADVPPPYPDSDALPEGWAVYQDAEGRTFYANAATGETSWEKPAAAASAAAPAESFGTWSTDFTYTIGPEGSEHIFEGKAPLLDKAVYSSVASSCDQMNAGTVAGVECGYCVIWSNSKQNYFLLWRSDREKEAFAALGIAED
eukprot:TRINITY_DN318_c0_g1_i1.p1 TRINITY_DN318_c0_g1~~TRINITY_DN318_c0_g1_i1.p1  ORF type:complete len:211 (+),score=33.15 TRINITY_DN318_c0_g1_i1:93-635(+)